MPTRRYLISGRVQGVFFRASTAETARQLALNGHARNLHDGRVEVLASGSERALAQLERFLWQGPPHARVSEVIVEDSAELIASGFSTG